MSDEREIAFFLDFENIALGVRDAKPDRVEIGLPHHPRHLPPLMKALALILIFISPSTVFAQGGGLSELKRTITLTEKGGVFVKKLKGIVANAKVKSFVVHVDWWTGPGDERVGDPEKARQEGLQIEVRHGRVWHALPPADRDLRLEARFASPEGLFEGESVNGEWFVRGKGGEKVQSVSIEITYLVPWGKGLAQPDLRVTGIVFDEIERESPTEGTYPLKRDFPELVAGRKYPARVHLANDGYGEARKPEISLFITRLDGKGRKRLPGIEIGIIVREGEDMRRKYVLPVPKLSPGLYLLHAVADPRRRANELDEENNEFTRVVKVTTE